MIAVLVLLAALLTATPAVALRLAAAPRAPVFASPYSQYADTAFQTFMTVMYDANKQQLRLTANSSTPSSYWNTAVAFQSLLHYANFRGTSDKYIVSMIYGLIETERHSNRCDKYLRNNYNDDMSWMIHGLTALYDHTGNHSLVDVGVFLHDYIRTSEDTTCCGNMKGGLWWDRSHTQKATAAQAGAALAALRLMETGVATKYTRDEWVDWAIAHYDFWLAHMVNATNYAVCDNINTQGEKRWWSFTYNEGLMLACAVHLYQATNDTRFLNDAAMFTQRLISEGETVTVNGQSVVILQNDNNPACGGDTSQFHQVSFEYLSEYYLLLTQLQMAKEASAVYTFLKNNIDSLWNNARNSVDGTFNCNWDAPFSAGTDALQGSMNSAMSATALFASLPEPAASQRQTQNARMRARLGRF